jgi:pimeloyl-ACP methyl ester carboxylesterase
MASRPGIGRSSRPDSIPRRPTPASWKWFLSISARESAETDAATKRYLRTINILDELPRIKTPTLILSAEHSPFGGENFRLMHRLIPNSELQFFYGVAPHFIFLTHREECLKAMLAFWRRLEA